MTNTCGLKPIKKELKKSRPSSWNLSMIWQNICYHTDATFPFAEAYFNLHSVKLMHIYRLMLSRDYTKAQNYCISLSDFGFGFHHDLHMTLAQ